jgi:glycosyltransferase involved in cell wall biosynthesis
MYRHRCIALVSPAYNEAGLIRPTLEHVPEYIDRIIVVDDVSTDRVPDVVRERGARLAR